MYESDLTKLKPSTPIARCVAELVLYARQYTGADWTVWGDRRAPGYPGSEYLGAQDDGRHAWRFWAEHDVQDFISDALRIGASHGIDVESTYHPYRDGSLIALLDLGADDE